MKNTETIEETNAQPTTKIVYRDIKNPGTVGMVIIELRMEHFDMQESDEVQEIHVWELVKEDSINKTEHNQHVR